MVAFIYHNRRMNLSEAELVSIRGSYHNASTSSLPPQHFSPPLGISLKLQVGMERVRQLPPQVTKSKYGIGCADAIPERFSRPYVGGLRLGLGGRMASGRIRFGWACEKNGISPGEVNQIATHVMERMLDVSLPLRKLRRGKDPSSLRTKDAWWSEETLGLAELGKLNGGYWACEMGDETSIRVFFFLLDVLGKITCAKRR